jgi:hypothetical protein
MLNLFAVPPQLGQSYKPEWYPEQVDIAVTLPRLVVGSFFFIL